MLFLNLCCGLSFVGFFLFLFLLLHVFESFWTVTIVFIFFSFWIFNQVFFFFYLIDFVRSLSTLIFVWLALIHFLIVTIFFLELFFSFYASLLDFISGSWTQYFSQSIIRWIKNFSRLIAKIFSKNLLCDRLIMSSKSTPKNWGVWSWWSTSHSSSKTSHWSETIIKLKILNMVHRSDSIFQEIFKNL